MNHTLRPSRPPPPPISSRSGTTREETHTLAVLVDNEPGVLARVIGLFSGRGYNIESLTVSETQHAQHLSRITVVTTGTRAVLEQIRNQLDRLVSVHRVTDLTMLARIRKEPGPLQRELALVKVAGTGEKRIEALRLADAFKAEVVDATTEHFIFQLTGRPSKIEQFIAIMQPMGLVEVCRTGIAAMGRGRGGDVVPVVFLLCRCYFVLVYTEASHGVPRSRSEDRRSGARARGKAWHRYYRGHSRGAQRRRSPRTKQDVALGADSRHPGTHRLVP